MVDVKQLYELFKKYPLISIDSRNILKDSIFFGLKGDNFDGNEFILDALKKGAAFAVTDAAVTAASKTTLNALFPGAL